MKKLNHLKKFNETLLGHGSSVQNVVVLRCENGDTRGVVSDWDDVEIVTKVLEAHFEEPITVVRKGEGYGYYVVKSPTNNFDTYTIYGETTNYL